MLMRCDIFASVLLCSVILMSVIVGWNFYWCGYAECHSAVMLFWWVSFCCVIMMYGPMRYVILSSVIMWVSFCCNVVLPNVILMHYLDECPMRYVIFASVMSKRCNVVLLCLYGVSFWWLSSWVMPFLRVQSYWVSLAEMLFCRVSFWIVILVRVIMRCDIFWM
jgi:hypothetical protein